MVLRHCCLQASRRMLAEPPLPGSEWCVCWVWRAESLRAHTRLPLLRRRNHNYVVSASSANDTYMNYNTPGMARPRMSIIEHRRARWVRGT